jgi:hypothetical protein
VSTEGGSRVEADKGKRQEVEEKKERKRRTFIFRAIDNDKCKQKEEE